MTLTFQKECGCFLGPFLKTKHVTVQSPSLMDCQQYALPISLDATSPNVHSQQLGRPRRKKVEKRTYSHVGRSSFANK